MTQRPRRRRRPWGWAGEHPPGSGRFGIRYHEPDGTHVREGPFDTFKQAQQALSTRHAEMTRGTYVVRQSMTVGDWLSIWLDSLATLGRRPTTIAGYRAVVRRHIEPSLGRIELQKLSPVDLDALYRRLLERGRRDGRDGGLSPRTVRYVHSVVRKALATAERKGLVTRNVALLADPPGTAAARAPEPQPWTMDETRHFLDAAHGHDFEALFRLAALTGMRRGELVGLWEDDLHLDEGYLKVRHAITQVEGVIHESAPKSARSHRTIELDAQTIAILQEHLRRRREQAMQFAWRSHLVFPNPLTGEPWRPESISQRFERTIARIPGLPKIRFHDLRHGHATHLLEVGENPRLVSDRLGHSTVAFTLDTYAHTRREDHARVAAKIAARFAP